uniref:Global nitrogen transcriptional regulator n=1 Tax=Antithamnion hubbsii TaxID=1005974 RepID=A0A4D6WK65_9FLOR|nr:global nitrogen transcriptional regulator [Antithamnion hubbsii]
MTWINYFSNSKIPFYIYKLKRGDSIIQNTSVKNHKCIIILHGIIYKTQIFTNNEILPVAILNKNNIIDINCHLISYKSYYKIIAIEETYIISFSFKNLKYNNKINMKLFHNLINGYKMTLYKYEIMRNILSHKYIKLRVIQLVLFLSIEFGIIERTQIKIPFIITKTDIAIMTGTNTNTINKIIKRLHKNKLIHYSTKNFISINNYFIANSVFLLN